MRRPCQRMAAGLILFVLAAEGIAEAAPLAAVNTGWTEQDPWLSPDGYTLYFSSDRDGGDFDIYQTQWDGERWSEPVALSGLVNSDFNETQPSLSADGRRLLLVSFAGHFASSHQASTRSARRVFHRLGLPGLSISKNTAPL